MDRIALIVVVLILAACGQDVPAKTWPEVVDKHWFVSGWLAAWLGLCLVWLVRGFMINVKGVVRKPEDKTP